MNNVIASLEALDANGRRSVYERLWFELTIAGRAVWSDPDLSDQKKLEGLKWLNEIQHRVWGAHQNPAEYEPGDLVGVVYAHVQQAPHIRGVVGASFRDALGHVGHA